MGERETTFAHPRELVHARREQQPRVLDRQPLRCRTVGSLQLRSQVSRGGGQALVAERGR
ncbi:MAG: hypothetical protein IPN32_01335 [Deltaproteobacteria bacterium]|nr:hypothetical protein [Deltaproteobacteria bacterium]